MYSSDRTTILSRTTSYSLCGTTGPTGPTGPIGIDGSATNTGATGPTGACYSYGNVAVVDAIYGNDSTASVGGSPYLTLSSAVSAISSGQTIFIHPGTYYLTSGITLPSGVSIRGLSLQTVNIRMETTTSATMITMGENCRIEDVNMSLICSGSTNNVVLKGIVFGGTTTQTSKLRTSVLTVNNSSMSSSLSSTVYGIEASGTGSLSAFAFSFNSIKGSTINVYSNGGGNKRGIIISGSNQLSIRDVNVYVAQPTNTTSSNGSFVGVETVDTSNIGSIQIRTSTIGSKPPSTGDTYTASDVLQTNPSSISDPTYLASAGVQIGPGTDLIYKNAGGKCISTYAYPLIVQYGLKGTLSDGRTDSYLWVGSMSINTQIPDTSLPPAFFRIQQPSILLGLTGALNTAPGDTNTVSLLIKYTPISTGILTDTNFSITFNSTDTFKAFYNSSLSLNTGDRIHLYLTFTGNNANLANDLSAQINLF